jgi:hypothetical protein
MKNDGSRRGHIDRVGHAAHWYFDDSVRQSQDLRRNAATLAAENSHTGKAGRKYSERMLFEAYSTTTTWYPSAQQQEVGRRGRLTKRAR